MLVTIHHIPVLLDESLDLLQVKPGGTYVDCTAGAGGHARAIAEKLVRGHLIVLDRDQSALRRTRERLANFGSLISFHHENFENLPLLLDSMDISGIDGCLADLGVSSDQLSTPERGFSFQDEGPLDMRMDRDQRVTAADLVNTLSEDRLAELLREFGEEPHARQIASAIVKRRQISKFRTTTDLAQLIASVKPQRPSHLHPATMTFQALRIEVNRELENLSLFLDGAIQLLNPNGRLVVISFHSLEDRIVKQTFKLAAGKCICFKPADLCTCPRQQRVRLLTAKPLTPSEEEVSSNPRSRSAKLRAIEKLIEGDK